MSGAPPLESFDAAALLRILRGLLIAIAECRADQERFETRARAVIEELAGRIGEMEGGKDAQHGSKRKSRSRQRIGSSGPPQQAPVHRAGVPPPGAVHRRALLALLQRRPKGR